MLIFEIALLWGSELIFICNDAYRIIAGGKHPKALGHSTRDIRSEVREFNKPIFERVMKRDLFFSPLREATGFLSVSRETGNLTRIPKLESISPPGLTIQIRNPG